MPPSPPRTASEGGAAPTTLPPLAPAPALAPRVAQATPPCAAKAAAASARMSRLRKSHVFRRPGKSKKAAVRRLARQVVGLVGADDVRETVVAFQAQAGRARGVPAAGPAADDAFDAFIGLPRDAVGDLIARHLAQRLRHVRHRDGHARQIDRRAVGHGVRLQFTTGDQRLDRAAGRQQPQARVGADRADRRFAIQGFADDAAGERGRSGIGTAGAHADGGQAQHAAVDEAAARVVRQQQFGDGFLRAVGRLRIQGRIVAHGLGQGTAVDGHRAAGRGRRAG
ncbi:hypothetical protein G6F68_012109 [Rhizopus microsporus]|nr:hypothetical protein G6F68_012109 [Rhizopus microsporus]